MDRTRYAPSRISLDWVVQFGICHAKPLNSLCSYYGPPLIFVLPPYSSTLPLSCYPHGNIPFENCRQCLRWSWETVPLNTSHPDFGFLMAAGYTYQNIAGSGRTYCEKIKKEIIFSTADKSGKISWVGRAVVRQGKLDQKGNFRAASFHTAIETDFGRSASNFAIKSF